VQLAAMSSLHACAPRQGIFAARYRLSTAAWMAGNGLLYRRPERGINKREDIIAFLTRPAQTTARRAGPMPAR